LKICLKILKLYQNMKVLKKFWKSGQKIIKIFQKIRKLAKNI
jgi:hypothetical protein